VSGDTLQAVIRALLALVGVCALAWASLTWLARRGIGLGGARGHGRIQVLERVTLAPRRQLYLVRADGKVMLLGAADGGAVTLIADLSTEPTEPGPST
jgi:flagellar biogenesis protein FliO